MKTTTGSLAGFQLVSGGASGGSFLSGWCYELVRACFYGGAAGHALTQVFRPAGG